MFGDALENLDFAYMGAFAASNGKWSFLTDYMYTDLSFGNETVSLVLEMRRNACQPSLVAADIHGISSCKEDTVASTQCSSLGSTKRTSFISGRSR
ncbi:hypothetical protein [Ruegeria faecimaris]|uniref:hypothetical protein n=1 Tax=Ruegeria faecimaris TaxID=686389 RepID=UPI0024913D4C|nr:hypothetical protein [Ruegeria faecimaris]